MARAIAVKAKRSPSKFSAFQKTSLPSLPTENFDSSINLLATKKWGCYIHPLVCFITPEVF
jgi:hypothetical protein